MLPKLEQAVLEGLRSLPPKQQQEVATFVKKLARKSSRRETVWAKIDARVKRVPAEVWECLPRDGAEQHDHYLYGAPKK